MINIFENMYIYMCVCVYVCVCVWAIPPKLNLNFGSQHLQGRMDNKHSYFETILVCYFVP